MNHRRWKDLALQHSLTINSSSLADSTSGIKSKKYNPNKSLNNDRHIYSKEKSNPKNKQISTTPKPKPLPKPQQQQDESFRLDIVKRQKQILEEIDSPLKQSRPYRLIPKTSEQKINSPVKESNVLASNLFKQKNLKLNHQIQKLKQKIVKELSDQLKFVQELFGSIFAQIESQGLIKSQDNIRKYKKAMKQFTLHSQKKIQEIQNDSYLQQKQYYIKLNPIPSVMARHTFPDNSYTNQGNDDPASSSNSHLNEKKHRKQRKDIEEFKNFFSAMGKLKQDMKSLNQIRKRNVTLGNQK